MHQLPISYYYERYIIIVTKQYLTPRAFHKYPPIIILQLMISEPQYNTVSTHVSTHVTEIVQSQYKHSIHMKQNYKHTVTSIKQFEFIAI